MYGKDSKAVSILKKYFTNTELSKELNLYTSLTQVNSLPESKAQVLLEVVCEQSKKLDRGKLEKEKYSLIKEIKRHYDLDEFFKAKIKEYRTAAAIYTLFEAVNTTQIVNTQQVVQSREIIVEALQRIPIQDSAIEAFTNEEREIKILSYKFLVEKFNKKYDSLTVEQKEILAEYINSISDTVKLKSYINKKIEEVKKSLISLSRTVSNEVTGIKLQEVIKNIQTVPEKQNLRDDHLYALMQYYTLLQELTLTVKRNEESKNK